MGAPRTITDAGVYGERGRPVASPVVRLSPKLRWQLSLVVGDTLTILLAAVATYAAYLGLGLGRQHWDPDLYLRVLTSYTVLTVFALQAHGAYRDELGLLRIDAITKILRGVTIGALLTLGVSFFARWGDFSRLTLVLFGPVTILALVAQRFLLWRLQTGRRGERARNALIYGAGETGRLLAQHLADEHQLGLAPVGFLDDDAALHGQDLRVTPGVDGERVPVFGDEALLDSTLRMTRAEVVFIAMPSAPSSRINEIIRRLEARGVSYFFVPSAGDLLFSTLRFGQLAGMPVFTRRQPAATRFYGAIKRGVDVVGATLLLIATAPLLLLGTLGIAVTSPGPVLFTQRRIGLDGRRFTIYKLRTMHREAPRYGLHPSDGADERVTRIGRLLRRTSIDELPQLFNVLRGEMSLVGPRPEMPFVVDEYNDIQRQRLTVKPGVTGLWQISADRAFQIHDNIQYDLYYIERRSTAMDLAILAVTPFVLLARNRAA